MAPEGGLGHHRRCGMKVFTAFLLTNQLTFTTARPQRNHRATTGFSDTFFDSLVNMLRWVFSLNSPSDSCRLPTKIVAELRLAPRRSWFFSSFLVIGERMKKYFATILVAEDNRMIKC